MPVSARDSNPRPSSPRPLGAAHRADACEHAVPDAALHRCAARAPVGQRSGGSVDIAASFSAETSGNSNGIAHCRGERHFLYRCCGSCERDVSARPVGLRSCFSERMEQLCRGLILPIFCADPCPNSKVMRASCRISTDLRHSSQISRQSTHGSNRCMFRYDPLVAEDPADD